ncbi:MAG: YqcC family protein [Porticoccaceae bacterium]|jgi:uncharacterized protein YqcC (DUF446 family)
MPVTETHIRLADELLLLEAELRNLQLWHREEPSAEALASVEPFACDTLAFTEWLQFIFIPRFHQMILAGAPLPAKCDVTPMAEEYFKGSAVAVAGVLASLQRIDRLITAGG